jgi:ribosomal protein L2
VVVIKDAMIDFKRRKYGIEGIIASIYDPNRNARIVK